MKKYLDITPFRDNCYRCFRPEKQCLCKFIKPFDTHTRFIILMHPKEARKIKNGTGRLTHLFLNNSRILIGEDFSGCAEVIQEAESSEVFPLLLFPGGREEFPALDKNRLQGKRPVIFIPDGTWRLAGKLVRTSENLRHMPRIGLSPPVPSQFTIKKEPRPECVSTIEALFYLLQKLEAAEIENLQDRHQDMISLLNRMVSYQLKCTASGRAFDFPAQPRNTKKEKK